MDKFDMALKLQELLDEAESKPEMKDIKGFEGRYAITKDGQVWSYRSKRYMALSDKGTGYLFIALYDKQKKKNVNYSIHKLVAEAFIPKPDDYDPEVRLEVGHRNDIRNDNRVENLYWCSHKENMNTQNFKISQRNKIFSKVMCVETGEIFDSIAAAGRWLGKHKYGINLCLLGKQKTCGGYHWKRIIENKESGNNEV